MAPNARPSSASPTLSLWSNTLPKLATVSLAYVPPPMCACHIKSMSCDSRGGRRRRRRRRRRRLKVNSMCAQLCLRAVALTQGVPIGTNNRRRPGEGFPQPLTIIGTSISPPQPLTIMGTSITPDCSL